MSFEEAAGWDGSGTSPVEDSSASSIPSAAGDSNAAKGSTAATQPHLTAATEHQPAVAAAIAAALARGPSHAYLLAGPPGTGKRRAARAFAAELLATAAPPDAAAEARRRALIDPSPHPDLIWLQPDGMQYRIDAVREQLLRPAVYRPYEGGRRVFVIEAAEALREESQNALLKTLEEPPRQTHILLLTSRPEDVLPTVRSRCQPLTFKPLPPAAVERTLREAAGTDLSEDKLKAVARLAAGDLGRAKYLLGPVGEELRSGAERLARATLSTGSASGAGGDESSPGARGGSSESGDEAPDFEPWAGLLSAAEKAGEEAEEDATGRIEEESEYGFEMKKTDRTQAIRREARRARTECLDLGLELLAWWYRDLAVVTAGAEQVLHNVDRAAELQRQAAGLTPERQRHAIEAISRCRHRLRLNVSEELALEALHSQLSADR